MSSRKPPQWTPQWGECQDCGEPIWMNGPAKKFCDKCKREHKRLNERVRGYKRGPYYQQEKQKKADEMERLRKLRQMMKEHAAKLEEDRTKHVCTHTGSCMYGSGSGGNRWCNYLFVTGKMRTAGGKHLIKDGKCDLYKRGRTHNEVGLKL